MYFPDAQRFNDTLGAFLAQVMHDPNVGKQFAATNALVKIEFEDPTATMWLDCRVTPPIVSCDPGAHTDEPDLLLSMTADTGHRFWLGKQSLPVALTSRKIKVKGPSSKLMRLLPALKPVFSQYEQFLLKQGRDDLLAV
jgi:hypothetical protein